MISRTTLAWAFDTASTLADMKPRLDALGLGDWQFGDSERLGPHLSGRLTPEAVARIYVVRVEGARSYRAHLRFYSEDENPVPQLTAAKQLLVGVVLPSVSAKDIRPTEAEE